VLQIHILSTMCVQIILEFSRDKVLVYTWGYQTDVVYYLALKCAQGLHGRCVIRNVACVWPYIGCCNVSGACCSVYALALNCMRCYTIQLVCHTYWIHYR
jgi:hypothetical protein